MKKTLLLFSLLWLPFLASAQWSVQITAGGGSAAESAVAVKQVIYSRAETKQETTSDFGYSFQGGIDVQYFINSKIGFGTGLGYRYSKSRVLTVLSPSGEKNWHAESIKIPFVFLWSPGESHRSVFNVGMATHFNLMRYDIASSVETNNQNPVFTSAQLGYAYKLGERFQVGILLDRDISWYSRTTNYLSETTLFYDRYFTSLQLTLSYRLFGSSKDKK